MNEDKIVEYILVNKKLNMGVGKIDPYSDYYRQ